MMQKEEAKKFESHGTYSRLHPSWKVTRHLISHCTVTPRTSDSLSLTVRPQTLQVLISHEKPLESDENPRSTSAQSPFPILSSRSAAGKGIMRPARTDTGQDDLIRFNCATKSHYCICLGTIHDPHHCRPTGNGMKRNETNGR